MSTCILVQITKISYVTFICNFEQGLGQTLHHNLDLVGSGELWLSCSHPMAPNYIYQWNQTKRISSWNSHNGLDDQKFPRVQLRLSNLQAGLL